MSDTAARPAGHENCGCHFDDGCRNWPNCGHVTGYANTSTKESKMAGPYDDVIGTDTTPTTITLTLPAREVAFMQSRSAGYGSGVDYLGEYEEAATDAAGIAQRIVRDTIGGWVVNEWRAKHPDTDDKPNEGMG